MESPEGFDDFLKTLGKLSGVFSSVEHKRREIIHGLATAKGQSFPAKLYHYTNMVGIRGII